MKFLFPLGLLFLGLVSRIDADASSPNIVLIVADDLGYGDLGCYGSESNQTPNIDALAEGGLRFTDFHTGGAMCSPTRASMLTGQYPQRFGKQFDGALSAGNPEDGLPLEVETIAELLKRNGYATGCFGKWHLGYQAPMLPINQGFDEFRGLLSGDGDFHTRVDRSGNEDWWWNDEPVKESGYTTDLLSEHSIRFVEQHRNSPFFLYLPHLAIHFPWQGPEDPPHRQKGVSYHQDKWGIIPTPGDVSPHVKAMVEALDRRVGDLMAALRTGGHLENTLVVFTSDNGGYLNYGGKFDKISSNGPFRGQKVDLYEGGHRVPLIVSWPAKVKPGVSNELVHSNDFFPTLAALAEAEVDAGECDGVNLFPLLFGEAKLPERQLFWRTGKQSAVRSGSWKLCITGKKVDLFDLGEDPGEQKNLAELHPDVVRTLRGDWEEWNRDVNQSASEYGR